MHPYRNLLEPYDFGFLALRNRMVMGAMHTRIETLDQPVARLAQFFRERARGEVGLILTGGFAPDQAGRMEDDAPVLEHAGQLAPHQAITQAVHEEGGRIVLQILHAGRYAKHPLCVGPTAQRAPINPHVPRAMTPEDIARTVRAIAHTASLARQAGYDGVEIMGSEGYLLNEFASARTNTRDDAYGGSFDNRIRLPIETVRAVRAAAGPDFLLIYRISAIDLVEDGMTGAESAQLARRLQEAGVDMLNTGIGWHESAIPTIAASVPRAGWEFAVRNIKDAVSIPVIASNRINTPEVGEGLLADGAADFVSMARPLLADPEFAAKTRLGQPERINSCIACNQACLDRIFTERTASCLVNPRAGRELDYPRGRAATPRRIAVAGGGAAGMAFAVYAAERGHAVTLYEAADTLGGLLNLARRIPGKREFDETLRYFHGRLAELDIAVRLGTRVTADQLRQAQYEAVVVATGVTPRLPAIDGLDHPKVAFYDEVLSGRREIGQRVAIIGTGGIAFDTAEFLLGDAAESQSPERFQRHWGIDASLRQPGGLADPALPPPRRLIHMLQRGHDKPGARLGKSTGWILKSRLRRAGVRMITGVTYHGVSDAGLAYACDGVAHVLPVDDVIVCAGQLALDELSQALAGSGMRVAAIGGARHAAELDAARAIEEALRLAHAF
ncbi:NADPH-dependent 2,4-dienoyl-CoA reductase [Bordetella bronchiseptica]|uniref:NADPH-dependent 2,4-dienoyl-CoA reductase n=1 Tax=Bordetella bronchiseptica TaxID=518 RepID=UPI000444BC6C|nr:NADPH-dependent 2,4-dienoyl-CoA reductase [Bordetella bronchiseptica]AWP86882.1 NADPH-dependent 2,4-dienoyl-CoA reductase [Bordetella bronchiseptica]AWQ12452.1 NADPH-dependent 2,4-dienoyl-CoA reductase [Bordetella bronchiseptica]AXT87207.1 NADPH-dependent 2,4-dienoyl-CoA reductase [Bordetella bronchiseptica]KDB83564.1 pyridine nucleotide-disulfide oxidoreductase [Bordetella bronchiseptica CARE970018BB]KDC81625.1 pyridine nucleotide-disulfide oxidoreductase [Bordetella bronchiseptica MBORD66